METTKPRHAAGFRGLPPYGLRCAARSRWMPARAGVSARRSRSCARLPRLINRAWLSDRAGRAREGRAAQLRRHPSRPGAAARLWPVAVVSSESRTSVHPTRAGRAGRAGAAARARARGARLSDRAALDAGAGAGARAGRILQRARARACAACGRRFGRGPASHPSRASGPRRASEARRSGRRPGHPPRPGREASARARAVRSVAVVSSEGRARILPARARRAEQASGAGHPARARAGAGASASLEASRAGPRLPERAGHSSRWTRAGRAAAPASSAARSVCLLFFSVR